jgi:mono/diheme cytochrome c family protein
MNRKSHIRIAGICLISLIAFASMDGCSSAPETDAERLARWQAGQLNSFEEQHGIGPITQDVQLGPVDQAKAALGAEIFKTKCMTCHRLDSKLTGPPLRSITKTRSLAYVMNQILNPELMGKLHPDGKRMVAQYMQQMTIQGITRDDAANLVEFLRVKAEQPPANE